MIQRLCVETTIKDTCCLFLNESSFFDVQQSSLTENKLKWSRIV